MKETPANFPIIPKKLAKKQLQAMEGRQSSPISEENGVEDAMNKQDAGEWAGTESPQGPGSPRSPLAERTTPNSPFRTAPKA